MTRAIIFILIFSPGFFKTLPAQTVTSLQGQLSGWLNLKEEGVSASQLGIRYIPTAAIESYLSDDIAIDAELALNAFGTLFFDSETNLQNDKDLDTYRLWARLTTAQLEIRIGLQKINFGSALILRPLMWFDRLDPRDPLQLTEGVYALLAKYTFLNNANLWAWGLYGNNETKGWEIIPGKQNSIEFGGRFQHPVLTGELALSYHHRTADPSRTPFPIPDDSTVPENRLALDGKWDAGIGIWFENSFLHQESDIITLNYRNFLTIGADYTIGIGNGLHVLAEHLNSSIADTPLGDDEVFNATAMLADYSFGLLDRLSAIVAYNWDDKQWSRFASWARIYDNWSFYLNVYWNPEEQSIIDLGRTSQSTFGRGKGLQLLAVFNH
jgi:hypothetical protein